jgi:hypothetical protein
MAITLDGTNGITTPDLESSGPVIGTTGTFSGNVSGVAGTFSGAVQASGVTTNLYPLVSETAKSATGATVQFTSIPSWVKRITVMFNEISTNGSSNVQIQLGDSGGYETSGYTGTAWLANTVNTAMSAGFLITATNSSTYTWNGSVILTNFGSNTWILQGSVGLSSVAAGGVQNGKKTLSDVLTQLQITTVNGTDTFDAGTVNILYE